MIGGDSHIISDPLMSITVSFLPKLLSNFKQNYQFGAPDWQGNVTKCDRDIHPLLLISSLTISESIRMIGRASDNISDPLMVGTVSFSTKNNSQISIKHTNFGLWMDLGNETLFHKDIHSLLLECIPTFL